MFLHCIEKNAHAIAWLTVCTVLSFGLFWFKVIPVHATYIPSVVSVFINSVPYVFSNQYSTTLPLTPSSGTTKTIYVNGRVMDEDGVGGAYEEGDLNTIELQLYRSNIGANCYPDPNDCYRVYCNVREYQPNIIEY